MKRNSMYPSASMQGDEEMLERSAQRLLIARAVHEVMRTRHMLISAAVYLRSERRCGRKVSVMFVNQYCAALDRVWEAQEALK